MNNNQQKQQQLNKTRRKKSDEPREHGLTKKNEEKSFDGDPF